MPTRLSGHAAYDLAEDEPDVDRVVGAVGARLPGRLLLLDGADVGIPVEPRAGRRVITIDHAITYGRGRADQHALLAGGGEFRPVARDRRIEIDHAAIDQHVRAQRAHALGDGIHDDDRVRVPRMRPGEVLVAAPEIHDLVTVPVDANGRPDFVALAKILLERVANRSEGRIARALNRNRSFVHMASSSGVPRHGFVGFAIGQTSIVDGGSSACLI